MNQDQLVLRFSKGEKLYLRITIALVAITLAFLILGLSAVKAIVAIPAAIVEIATYLLYFNVGHLVYGFIRIFYYFFKIRPTHQEVSLKYTIISMIFSPVNMIILYTAILLMALTGCVA